MILCYGPAHALILTLAMNFEHIKAQATVNK